MATIPWQQARNLIVVDPDSGREIPHVKATDPDKGWIEVYSVTPCAPYEGMEMVRITKAEDGTEITERFHYTFVQMRDFTGQRFYLTRQHRCRFDLVNKYTGEVIHEVPGPRAPERALDPAAATNDVGFFELGRHRATP